MGAKKRFQPTPEIAELEQEFRIFQGKRHSLQEKNAKDMGLLDKIIDPDEKKPAKNYRAISREVEFFLEETGRDIGLAEDLEKAFRSRSGIKGGETKRKRKEAKRKRDEQAKKKKAEEEAARAQLPLKF